MGSVKGSFVASSGSGYVEGAETVGLMVTEILRRPFCVLVTGRKDEVKN